MLTLLGVWIKILDWYLTKWDSFNKRQRGFVYMALIAIILVAVLSIVGVLI